MWTIETFLQKILALIFPPSCYVCHKQNTSLCSSCLNTLQKSIHPPHPYIRSTYNYQDRSIKKLIHAIKYFNRKDLIEPLAEPLLNEVSAIITSYPSSYTWLLVPIPMPRLRKILRGYNQAELIAKVLAKKGSLSYNNTFLKRSRSPKRQVTAKTKSLRINNQRNSFKVMHDMSPFAVILIDDVTTTGATIEEARKTLLHHGALVVHAVTLAH